MLLVAFAEIHCIVSFSVCKGEREELHKIQIDTGGPHLSAIIISVFYPGIASTDTDKGYVCMCYPP